VRVLEHIDADPGSCPTNQELASLACLSVNGFIRLFREQTGQSPRSYVLESRLRGAALRLLHGSDSIDTIAAELGFYDRSYFGKMFRRKYGVAPGRYRREA